MLKITKVIAAVSMVAAITNGTTALDGHEAIEQATQENADRLPGDAARDNARHPAAVMTFLGFEPEMTIAEINPGGGWYSRILAPFVRGKGRYVGLEHHPDIYSDRYPKYAEGLRAFPAKVKGEPDLYGAGAIGAWIPAKDSGVLEAGSLDVVIAVRALHNWIEADFFDSAAYKLQSTILNAK